MSETFNAHELLQRLRSERGVSNAPTASMYPTNVPQSMESLSNTTSPVNKKKTGKSNTIVTTVNFLTPSERREHLEVRAEMDSEISRLQDEVKSLRSDKKQLLQENELLKQQLDQQKKQSDSKIASLRNQIAKMTNAIEEMKCLNDKRSKVFASMGIFGMAAQNTPSKKKISQSSAGMSNVWIFV